MTTQKIQIAVKATPEQVWDALTNGKITPGYYIGGFEADFDLQPGKPYRYTVGGHETITGTVTEVEPGRRLVTTFQPHWDESVAQLPESTVTYTIVDPPMQFPGITYLTLVHGGLPEGPLAHNIEMGWVTILSALKTLLETDVPMLGSS